MRRFIAADENSVVVFGLVPDKNLTQLVPIVDQLDARLNAVRKADPGYGIAVTGLPVIAARNSAGMINKLNRALTFEFAFIAAFIGLAFRSARIGLACLPSGIFPIVAAGSVLRLLGYGLQFSGVVALTVSFGLGLSATIHFLNRMTQERQSRRRPGDRSREGDSSHGARAHLDRSCARLRPRGARLFRPSAASPVRLAGRARHARSACRRSPDPEACHHFPAPLGARAMRQRSSRGMVS